ncbi:excinuclease ABC subunit UvrA, partial [Candidatus Marinamargulisbacteria bacterium SCGC AAA071-K20]
MKEFIEVQNARVHNLKNVSVKLPRNKLIVFTGMSGSGKSSLAFDTIYAEGQRRYMESLSAYARQFLDQLDKPDVDFIDGLSPAISIDQKSSSHNPRSTVGTITEIYDYYRLLFASIGKPHCPHCKKPVSKMSIQEIRQRLYKIAKPDERVQIMSPLIKEKKGEFRTLFEELQKEGFSRVLINGEIKRLDEGIRLNKNFKQTIDVIVDRLKVNPENESRLYQSIETATKQSEGLVTALFLDQNKSYTFSEHLTCPDCNISIEEISHRLFSFNSPIGACPECKGLGDKLDFDSDLVVENPEETVRHCTSKVMNLDNTYYGRSVEKLGKEQGFTLDTRFDDLNRKQQNFVLYGTEDAQEENPR